MELRNQPRAGEDHHRAQHERAEDAVHQHPLLRLRRHAEIREHEQEHEDVVDRERFLDQVAGDELQRFRIGDLSRGGIRAAPAEIPPQHADEQEADRDPDDRPDRGFAQRDAVGALMPQREEIDRERDRDEPAEREPDSGGAYEFQVSKKRRSPRV